MKTCIDCKQTLPESNYYRSYVRNGKTVLKSDCKECNKIRTSNWHKAHRNRTHGYNIKHEYGITLQQYKELIEKSNNSCSICKKPQSEFKRRLHIDHCHTSGKIRGLLCYSCNAAIGLLFDNVQLMRNAISYLGDK